MTNDDDVTPEHPEYPEYPAHPEYPAYQSQLRDAVERSASRMVDWTAFHSALADAVAPQLSQLAALRRRASGGYRATAAAGAAWWDYAARAALAAVPLGLAAALLLFTYLRSDAGAESDSVPAASSVAVVAGSSGSARDAFESVLTGAAAPRAAMRALIPVPAAGFLADSAGGGAR
jgi:hypothetical protein